jgi:hypothetical protein
MKMKMTKNFKIGDWCFYEAELVQIKRMEGNKICEVTTGTINTSSSDLSEVCFPLELPIKRISDGVEWYKKEFHRLGSPGLNHPDINRKVNRLWANTCNHLENDKLFQSSWEEVEKFCNAVIKKINDLKSEDVDGVNLFRR